MKIKKEDRNLLIAVALGDGYICKKGSLQINHSPRQKEYIEYKHSLVSKLYSCNLTTRKFSNGFDTIQFRTKQAPFLKVLRRVLYPSNKKTLNRKLLNRLDLRGLAIWWMDDGTKGIKYNKDRSKIKACVYRLCLCTTKEQCQIVIDW